VVTNTKRKVIDVIRRGPAESLQEEQKGKKTGIVKLAQTRFEKRVKRFSPASGLSFPGCTT
jgi:hypothetical protein